MAALSKLRVKKSLCYKVKLRCLSDFKLWSLERLKQYQLKAKKSSIAACLTSARPANFKNTYLLHKIAKCTNHLRLMIKILLHFPGLVQNSKCLQMFFVLLIGKCENGEHTPEAEDYEMNNYCRIGNTKNILLKHTCGTVPSFCTCIFLL